LPPTGYECEIVESPPWAADFPTNCPICLHVLRDPQLTNCGHTFCKMCIKQAQSSKVKTCPECKQTKVTTFPRADLQRKLNDLQVRCRFQFEEQVCDWRGKLKDFEKHLNLVPTCEDELFPGYELTFHQKLILCAFEQHRSYLSHLCNHISDTVKGNEFYENIVITGSGHI